MRREREKKIPKKKLHKNQSKVKFQIDFGGEKY